MPIFEYQCKKCQHKFELMIKTKEEDPGACPNCGNRQLTKLFSTPAVRVKRSTSSADIETRCGKDTTCCGSTVPCDSPSCGS
jgi:putative FmdB family regulatory protein